MPSRIARYAIPRICGPNPYTTVVIRSPKTRYATMPPATGANVQTVALGPANRRAAQTTAKPKNAYDATKYHKNRLTESSGSPSAVDEVTKLSSTAATTWKPAG